MKKLFLLAVCLFFVLSKSQAQTNPTSGGPDAYGYTWKDSRHPSAPETGKWVEIVSPLRPGTIHLQKALPEYTYYGPINFSFDFPFYWYTRNQLFIDQAGAIDFEGHTLGSPYEPVPERAGNGNDIIAPFLSGLGVDTTDATSGTYFWTDFKDSVVITWENMKFSDNSSNTVQLILNRADGAITFQYAKQIGTLDAGCLAAETNNETADGKNYTCLAIGIENQNGDIGLKHSEGPDNLTYFTGVTKAAPYIVRYKASDVATKNLVQQDIAVDYSVKKGTPGVFISKDGDKPFFEVNVKNIGTTDINESLLIKTQAKRGTTAVGSPSTKNIDPLKRNQSQLLKSNVSFPNDKEGVHTFESVITYKDDKFASNNRANQLVMVVDTTKPAVLDYTNGVGSPDFTYLGSNFSAGVGVFIEPPYYPCKITGIRFNVTSFNNPVCDPTATVMTDDVRLTLYDDGGKNVFGVKDGSRGKNIFSRVLLRNVDFKCGENTIMLDQPYQINSGGVYLGLSISGPTISFVTDEIIPHSNRTYELRGESFYIFSDRKTKDFTMGVIADKGDVSKTIDLSLTELVSPTEKDTIKEPTDVIVKFKNTGPTPITGPFDVVYKADLRSEVREEIPATVTLAPGQEMTYTFKQKTSVPPFPKTNYGSFCAKVYIPNDFVLTNDEICYGVVVGVDKQVANNSLRQLKLMPNPATNFVSLWYELSNPQQLKLEITNINGQIVLSENLGTKNVGYNSHQLNLMGINKGLYFVKLISNEQIITEKLVIN